MPYQVIDPALAVAAPVTTIGAPLTSVGETLATFLDELTAEIADRTDLDSALLTDTLRKTKLINWAYRHICSIINLKSLLGSIQISITDDKDFYLLPAQVAVAKKLSIINTADYASGGAELEKIDLGLYRQLPDSGLLTTFAEPTKWFPYDIAGKRMIVVWPTPSTARVAALDCKLRPTKLTNSTDSPILPEEYHEAILRGALHRVEWAVRNKAAAREEYNEMLTILRPIIDTDGEENVNKRNRAYMPATLRRIYSRSGWGSQFRDPRWGGQF